LNCTPLFFYHLLLPSHASLSPTQVRDALLEFLPEGNQTVAELTATMTGVPLSAAARRFTGAAHSENVNSIFATFGLSPADGAAALHRGDNVRALLDAMQVRHGGGAEAAGTGGGEEALGAEGSKAEGSDDDMYDD